MRVRVLGNAARYLAPLSGGSSYLVEHDGTRVLLDAGGGARDALAALDVRHLDAVVLSHFHFDHVQDFVGLGAAMDPATTVFVPPGEARRLDALAEAYAFQGRFELDGPLVEAAPGRAHAVGPLRLSFAPTQHSAPSVATRVGTGGASLAYASDTAPCDALRDLARGADVLLMHTLLPDVEAGAHHARVHATARSAGALAREAEARRLVLSHRFFESRDEAMTAAAGASHGDVTLARTGDAFDVTPTGA